jgi:hypothetical protein
MKPEHKSLNLQRLQPHQLINQSSGNVEYYTPLEIVQAAKRTMGGLDLDPASSKVANARINAPQYFAVEDDGLTKPWHGRVWLNPPFLKGHTILWIRKLHSEYESQRIEAACCITWASTSEAWFRGLLKSPQCYLYKRTNFYLPDGSIKKNAPRGCVVTYLGREPLQFYDNFKHLGEVKISFASLTTIPSSKGNPVAQSRRAA